MGKIAAVADLTRVIKGRDFDGDGRTDVFVGNLPDHEPPVHGRGRRSLR